MRVWTLLLVMSAVPAMAQVQMLKEDAPPLPSLPVTLQGADGRVVVPMNTLQRMAVAEPEIAAPEGAPREGVVSLRVKVSRTGQITEAIPAQADEALRHAAVDGVLKRWTYRPLLVNGEPQEFQSSLVLEFRDGVGKPAVIGVMGGVMGNVGPGTTLPMPIPGAAVRISAGVAAGMMEHPVAPVYPPIAKAAHVQGVVILHALISKTGEVENLQVISGPPMLVASAMDAVKKWTYKPYLLNGVPTEVETTINVNFTFSESTMPIEGGGEIPRSSK
jgi:TonB family protein